MAENGGDAGMNLPDWAKELEEFGWELGPVVEGTPERKRGERMHQVNRSPISTEPNAPSVLIQNTRPKPKKCPTFSDGAIMGFRAIGSKDYFSRVAPEKRRRS